MTKATPRSTVFMVTDQEGDTVEEARIYLVTSEGVKLLARRRQSGDLLAGDLSAIAPDQDGALLACAEGYYCAGWLLQDPFIQPDLGSKGRILWITLTRLGVR